MSSIDERVVNMKFNNGQFEQGVKTTLSSLEALKKGLKLEGATKGLSDVSAMASKGINLSSIAQGVENISSKFSALGVVAVTALATIANRAVSAGMQVARSFTIQPIMDGLDVYQTKLNSIQTVLANTGLSGSKGLGQVNATLADLNQYSNQTIYNFSEMARNIGTFTAAGVDLKTSTEAIKGIANLAAVSGSSAEQASTAMYQLSQALASGTVKLMDWNSVVNAGMGGKVFQNALMETAKVHGVAVDAMIKKDGSFRETLQEGWLTSQILTETLGKFTGDYSDAQLKSMGYTAEQIKEIQQLAKTATDAATKVKTLPQLMSVLKETVSTGWAASFELLIGNLDEAKTLFTNINNVVGGFISKSAEARNKVLKDWKDLGGRSALIDAISLAFKELGDVLRPIHDAFREIFPAKTGQDLFNLTKSFHVFIENLQIGKDTAENIKRTFAGFFAILDIGKQIVVGIFHVIATLFGAVAEGGHGFLNLTGNIGDFLVSVDQALKKGGQLNKFFDNIGAVLAFPIKLLTAARQAIGDLFAGFKAKDADAMAAALQRVQDRFSGLVNLGSGIGKVFRRIGEALQPVVDAITQGLASIGTSLANSMSSGNFQGVFDVINTTLLGGILLLVKKFFSQGINIDLGGGMLGSMREAFQTLTGSMKDMQTQIKAKTLLMIASAVGILTASIVALSMIDSQKMTNALKGMAVGFAELLGAMKILTSISSNTGFLKVPLIAGSMILLAGAILVLTAAVKNLSNLSWEELSKGLIGVGVLLAAVSAASIPLSKNSAGLIRAGVGIAAIAVAMNILYLAVKNFSSLSWTELGKGLAAVAGSLVGIAVAMKLMPTGMVATGAGLIEISVALNAIYLAVKNFSSLSWKEMAKGLAAVVGSLGGIALAMKLMPPGIVAQSAGILIISGAMLVLGKALSNMAKMSWKEIGKGLATLAASLAIFAGGLQLMTGALPGAAALLVAATALRIFVPVLKELGSMKWSTILKGLEALAAMMGVLGLAALAMTPVAPALLAIGVACVTIGAGIFLAATGIGLLAAGLGVLGGVGLSGVAVLLTAIDGLISKIPALAVAFANGLVQVAKIIGENAPVIMGAFANILDSFLDMVIKEAPVLATAFAVLLTQFLKVVRDKAPDIIATGFELLMDLLKGISDNIEEITKKVSEIVIKFLGELAKHAREIAKGGLDVLTQFLQGMIDGLPGVAGAVTQLFATLITEIGKGFTKMVDAGFQAIVNFLNGIGKGVSMIIFTATSVIIQIVMALQQNANRLVDAGFQALVNFLNGIADAIRKHAPELREAGWNIATAIVDGLTGGLASKAEGVVGGAVNLGKKIIGGLGSAVGLGSPAKEFIKIGSFMGEGLLIGLDSQARNVELASEAMGQKSINIMKDTLNSISDAISGPMDLTPTITPVLDLSNVRKDASKIGALISPNKITVGTTFVAAKDAAASVSRPVAPAASAQDQVDQPASLTFIQNNNSPKALSTAEIYRQTKNQISQARGALTG